MTCASEQTPEYLSVVPPHVIRAYCEAVYFVTSDGQDSGFRIDQASDELARIMRRARAEQAVLITAWNPLGQECSQPENEAASARLRSTLDSMEIPVLAARGEDPGGVWPSEQGYLALGLSCPEGARLGKHFNQNAIVFIPATAIADLVLLR